MTRIATRLLESQNSTATLTTFNEADMTAIQELRARYNEKFEKKHGVKLGFMSVFVKQPQSVGPKLPGGEEVSVPTFAKGEEFALPPDRQTKYPGQPKFDTLQILAEQLPRADRQ